MRGHVVARAASSPAPSVTVQRCNDALSVENEAEGERHTPERDLLGALLVSRFPIFDGGNGLTDG